MNSSEVREKYLKFFESKGHKIIPSSPIVPENDPSTLFTTAGMQPMIPYLLGESHPEGTRIVDSQKCFRSNDIDEVGDNRHQTLFEMLGNWSLGDYFKSEQLKWFFTFLTSEVGLDPNKLFVTAFSGEPKFDLPKDSETVEIWQKLFAKFGIEAKSIEIGSEENGAKVGMQGGRIFYYDSAKNWWSRSGKPENMPIGEPGGPDSEVFYEFSEIEHDKNFGENCHPNCDCGRYLEIGNSVFMQYIRTENGFEKLPKANVDFGGGLERITTASINQPDVFRTDLFWSVIRELEIVSGLDYSDPKIKNSFRIIADHIKASMFLIADGVVPANKLQGYVLRRLLRRAAVKIELLGLDSIVMISKIVPMYLKIYEDTDYFKVGGEISFNIEVIDTEIRKFKQSVNKGLREAEKIQEIDGKKAFDLYQSYGFPLEITTELFAEKGQTIDLEQFKQEFEAHKTLSQTASKGMFKGGLADSSEETKKLHTATHLMNQALHLVLGDHIMQHGSNVTAERLRFDFNHPSKLTENEIAQIEELVNQKIQADLQMQYIDLPKDKALSSGALHAFNEKYADICRIYFVGESIETAWSKEFCGGPHVTHTGILGKFKITKEESVSAGIRRIYAVVE